MLLQCIITQVSMETTTEEDMAC